MGNSGYNPTYRVGFREDGVLVHKHACLEGTHAGRKVPFHSFFQSGVWRLLLDTTPRVGVWCLLRKGTQNIVLKGCSDMLFLWSVPIPFWMHHSGGVTFVIPMLESWAIPFNKT